MAGDSAWKSYGYPTVRRGSGIWGFRLDFAAEELTVWRYVDILTK